MHICSIVASDAASLCVRERGEVVKIECLVVKIECLVVKIECLVVKIECIAATLCVRERGEGREAVGRVGGVREWRVYATEMTQRDTGKHE